jgi:hypothetical protein
LAASISLSRLSLERIMVGLPVPVSWITKYYGGNFLLSSNPACAARTLGGCRGTAVYCLDSKGSSPVPFSYLTNSLKQVLPIFFAHAVSWVSNLSDGFPSDEIAIAAVGWTYAAPD